MNRFACSALVFSALALAACSAEESGDPSQETTGTATTAPAPASEQAKEEAPTSATSAAAPATASAAAPSDVADVDDGMDVEARSWGVKAGIMVNGHLVGLTAGRTVEVSLEDGTRSVDGILQVQGPLGSTVKIERNTLQYTNTTPGDYTVELGASTTWRVTVVGPLGHRWGGRPWSYAYNFKVNAGN